jgi:predicted dehydrogenase
MNRMLSHQADTRVRPLRLGFLGVGWIGRNRMQALIQSGLAEATTIVDPSPHMIEEAMALSPKARHAEGLDDLLADELDGVVIATPSADHAAQSIRALKAGKAVFCQKPLGRTAGEAQAVVTAARAADRLLGVDLSYRHTSAMQAIRALIESGELGKIFSVDLTFHNAYGPDKSWFYDRRLSGGGCLIDLGVHLIDLVLWCLGYPAVSNVSSRLLRDGKMLTPLAEEVEDFASATFDLGDGTTVRLACSWRLQAGRDAVIEAKFFGTNGGCGLRNIDGSFYDLTAERYSGTHMHTLVSPPDDWGGRAALAWARRLTTGNGFDEDCETIVSVAETIDRIYGAGS